MTEDSGKAPKALLVLASILVSLGLLLFIEVALRLSGFEYYSTPRYMRFNYPDPETLVEIFEPDPERLWKLKPGTVLAEDIEPVNSKGFRGPEFDTDKSPGIVRVIAMGDSVTFAGRKSYPRLLGECLGDGYEVINAGVPGYTVFQGLRYYETSLAGLNPDVVTIMFGWNDHWLARGYPDPMQRVMAKDHGLPGFLKNLRIFQVVRYALSGIGGMEKPGTTVRRVPLDEYRALLDRLVNGIVQSGATPILITAPTALDGGVVPGYLFEGRFLEIVPGESESEAAERLRDLHGKYAEAAREVAARNDVPLIDLEKKWREIGSEDLFDAPDRDVIHPNEKGYDLIGMTVCDKVESLYSSQHGE